MSSLIFQHDRMQWLVRTLRKQPKLLRFWAVPVCTGEATSQGHQKTCQQKDESNSRARRARQIQEHEAALSLLSLKDLLSIAEKGSALSARDVQFNGMPPSRSLSACEKKPAKTPGERQQNNLRALPSRSRRSCG